MKSNQYIKETLKLRKDIETAFIFLGERLYKIRKDNLWEGMYNNYEEFLGEMEISTGQASKLRQIYEVLILQQKFKPQDIAHMGIRKLYAILPACTDKDASMGQIEISRGLSVADVELEMKQLQVGKHEHDWYTYKRCSVCHEMQRIYDKI